MEASLVTKTAQQALAQSVASAAMGATAALSPSSPPQGVAFQRTTTWNDALFKGIIARMASAPRVDFLSALATAVVATASALLPSARPASWQVHDVSVEAASTRMGCTLYARRTRVAPTLAFVKALLTANDDAPDPGSCSLSSWSNLRRRFCGTQPGETVTQRQSRQRGPQPRKWRQKWWGWRPTTTTAGVTAVVEAGGAPRVLLWLTASQRRQRWSNNQGRWPQLWRSQRGVEE